MGRNYKTDERAIKYINRYVKPVLPINKINTIIYYKSKSVKDMIIRNNSNNSVNDAAQKSDVVYEFTCKREECLSSKNSYIGMPRCKLADRLYKHFYQGSIFNPFHTVHSCRPAKDELLRNTKILYHADNRCHLPIIEALHIRKFKPELNENMYDFYCLKLYRRGQLPFN